MELKWTQEEFVWVESNMNELMNATASNMDFRNEVYRLYNKIGNTNKLPNSCGRCWRSTKQQVVQYFNKIKNII